MLLMPERLRECRENMEQALAEGRPTEAAEASAKLSPTRCAAVLGEAKKKQQPAVLDCLRAMPGDRAALVLTRMAPALAAELLESASSAEATGLLSRMTIDHAADVLAAMHERNAEWASAVSEALDASLRIEIETLARYEAGTAGAVMKPYFLSVRRGTTVADAIEAVDAAPEIDRSAYIYVVDAEDRPLGVLSLRDLVTAEEDHRVEQIMTRELVAVRVGDPAIEGAKLLHHRRLKLLPVLDANDRIAGVMSVGDAMDLIAHNVASQFVKVGGGSEDEGFFTPPMGSIKRRLPWMGANVFLNLGAVWVITGFEETIATVAILAAFLPMITDMGGNVGIQALSVAIRSIALGEARLGDFWRAIRKETLIGLVNGLALGLLFAALAFVMQGNVWIGLIAGLALGVNVLVAGVVGGTMPFLIKRLGKDPAMMTGPILTTITDITGVTIYLGLCTIFLMHLTG